MAILAADYPTPIKPYGGMGGTMAAGEFEVPVSPSVDILEGDIITLVVATKDATNTQAAGVSNPTGATGLERVFGVASYAQSTGASVDRDASADYLSVYPAYSDKWFTGNVCAGATDS